MKKKKNKQTYSVKHKFSFYKAQEMNFYYSDEKASKGSLYSLDTWETNAT